MLTAQGMYLPINVRNSRPPSDTAANARTTEYKVFFNQYPKTKTRGNAVSISLGRNPTIFELAATATTTTD